MHGPHYKIQQYEKDGVHVNSQKCGFIFRKENDEKLNSCKSSFTSNLTKHLKQYGIGVKVCMVFDVLQSSSPNVSSASSIISQAPPVEPGTLEATHSSLGKEVNADWREN